MRRFFPAGKACLSQDHLQHGHQHLREVGHVGLGSAAPGGSGDPSGGRRDQRLGLDFEKDRIGQGSGICFIQGTTSQVIAGHKSPPK